ncbi:hypothetical protein F503_03248 [Ophiostoma piceae UAMH 11346]|uniref:HNH nuclease domain-containing protein n=1 Tax=Ophiostoma piceae (strain UAMH 11346) TaxID=1262450 RepID=S3C4Q6_OPHP1|nr:hypothetical protein F503_03248 [Ophiostoma piceae UAMH 11346]
MSSPLRHHKHQASLEDVIGVSLHQPVPLTPTERIQARATFRHVVDGFEQIDNARGPNSNTRGFGYSQPRLIRGMHDFALSEESRDIFLRAFLSSMALPIDGNTQLDDLQELAPLFSGFAEYLMDNFFLPLKASTRRTPQPSPAYHSAVLRAQGGAAPAFVGTSERLSALRGTCLVRDRFRCVVSRRFSANEWIERVNKHGDDACDDDGNLLLEEDQFDHLEVAHILPHSLTRANANAELPWARGEQPSQQRGAQQYAEARNEGCPYPSY